MSTTPTRDAGKAAHTATPWTTHIRRVEGTTHIEIYCADGRRIAQFDYKPGSLKFFPASEEEAISNAAFIVHACNAHEQLVRENAELAELLRQVNEAANKVYQMGDATCRNALVNIYEISGKVLALRAARGGEV
jgi:hypothetical protein